jgi:hypothetical protein
VTVDGTNTADRQCGASPAPAAAGAVDTGGSSSAAAAGAVDTGGSSPAPAAGAVDPGDFSIGVVLAMIGVGPLFLFCVYLYHHCQQVKKEKKTKENNETGTSITVDVELQSNPMMKN